MKVVIEKPAEGRVIVSGIIAVNPNNTDFGSIMLSQTNFALNVGGFMNQEKRVTFISGRVDDLKNYVEQYKLTVGCDYSERTGIPHRLVVTESTTPYFEGQSPKVNPKTNEALHTADGELIYRRVSLVAENAENAVDSLIAHVPTAIAVEAEAKKNVMSDIQ